MFIYIFIYLYEWKSVSFMCRVYIVSMCSVYFLCENLQIKFICNDKFKYISAFIVYETELKILKICKRKKLKLQFSEHSFHNSYHETKMCKLR